MALETSTLAPVWKDVKPHNLVPLPVKRQSRDVGVNDGWMHMWSFPYWQPKTNETNAQTLFKAKQKLHWQKNMSHWNQQISFCSTRSAGPGRTASSASMKSVAFTKTMGPMRPSVTAVHWANGVDWMKLWWTAAKAIWVLERHAPLKSSGRS